MIKLSKLADYAFLLLLEMAANEGKSVSATGLAESTGLPTPTVAKLLKQMTNNGILVASRGVSGGYRLAQKETEITVAAIIEAVDGPIALTGCVGTSTPTCTVHSLCCMRAGWHKLNDAMRLALASVTLAELRAPAEGLPS